MSTHTILFEIERELPCECLALSTTPFAACACCDGTGESWQEIVVSVEYAFFAGSLGSRWEPEESDAVEIQSVTDARGHEWLLTKREEERAEERCFQDVRERRDDAMEARTEARAERIAEERYMRD